MQISEESDSLLVDYADGFIVTLDVQRIEEVSVESIKQILEEVE